MLIIRHVVLLKQVDVEIDFELTSIDIAVPFDPSWLLDVEKHCREAGASVHGGIRPLGLIVLISDNMEEHTAVHFRVYKSEQKEMILIYSDLRRLMLMVFALMCYLSLKMSDRVKRIIFFSLHSSSLRPRLCTPAYGGFFEFDLQKEKKISLRTLVSLGSYFISPGVHFTHYWTWIMCHADWSVSGEELRRWWQGLHHGQSLSHSGCREWSPHVCLQQRQYHDQST